MVGGAILLAFVAITPGLLFFLLIGCGLGLTVALGLGLTHEQVRAKVSRRWMLRAALVLAWAVAVGAPALALLNGAGFPSFQAPSPEGLLERGLPTTIPAPPLVRENVTYEAVLEFDDDQDEWAAEEFIRIPSRTLASSSIRSVDDRPGVPPFPQGSRLSPWDLLRDEWRFIGYRGPEAQSLAYRRTRQVQINAPGWPPVTRSDIPLGGFPSPVLPVVFVPRAGSRMELRAPKGFVREVDATTATRHFNGLDVVVFHLAGLGDAPTQRVVSLRIADGIGRWTTYRVVEEATAWMFVKLLCAGVPGLFVAYFVTWQLKRRFPEPDDEGPSGGGPRPPERRQRRRPPLPDEAIEALVEMNSKDLDGGRYCWDPRSRTWHPA